MRVALRATWWLIGLGLSAIIMSIIFNRPAAPAEVVAAASEQPCKTFHCSNEPLRLPVYPTRPLPPDARDVRVQIDESGRERITFFTTALTPAEVFAFYRHALVEDGWSSSEPDQDSMEFGYLNTVAAPAFDLAVIILATPPDLTEVKIRHVISGPFSSSDWPED
ncbi:MAG: hypothetical protein H0T53_06595 [Herpetosiphonaceae bacterium]|nr:hypothetical protein [Herpetosiphonaceae bacterium]